MIGAMKRKASLSFSEGCSTSSQSPQSLNNCQDNNYHNNGHGPSLIVDMECNKKAYISNNSPTSAANNIITNNSPHGHGPKPEKRIRWDGPRTQSLIDHYRVHEYLWNPKLADYKNDKKRTHCLEAWLEQNHLEKELVNEVKMKLHGLRTSFGHQLKLENTSDTKIEDDATGAGFQSKWQWYQQLSFLKETMVFRSGSSNNNHSPSDSPPPSSSMGDHIVHGHLVGMSGHHHDELMASDVKMELNAPLNMQVMCYPHHSEIPEYLVQHHSQQPHNLSVSAVPIPMQAHETHPTSILSHSRQKDEEDPLSYHCARITATPPMAHMNLSTTSHSQPPPPPQEIARYQSNFCCSDRPRSGIGEKLGRLVEETFNNLHPEYQEMAKIEIQQILGKYLQKIVP